MTASAIVANPADVRLELAYDVLFYCALAMLDASKLELDSDRGHQRDAMEFLINTLRLRGKNEEGVMWLYAARATRYDGAMLGTPEEAERAAVLAERILAEADGWFDKNHPTLK